MSYIKVGDIVKTKDLFVPLCSGSYVYSHAVVIKTNPVILVSEEADMRWNHFPTSYMTVIGKASWWTVFKLKWKRGKR